MKNILATIFILVICSAPCEARGSRPTKLDKFNYRQQKLDTGVTLTRARTQMYRAQAVANVTGLFTPFGIIANLLGR